MRYNMIANKVTAHMEELELFFNSLPDDDQDKQETIRIYNYLTKLQETSL